MLFGQQAVDIRGHSCLSVIIKISGFGNFIVKQKHARRGRNPQTGVEIESKRRKVLLFGLSGVLNDEINEQG